MGDNMDKVPSIPEFFSGQTVLITGGSGLMGKVLVEKMLRSCPGVSKIYLLMRAKKGVAMEERWAKLTQLPLFDRLKQERPDALEKIELISGNFQEEQICPSEEDNKKEQKKKGELKKVKLNKNQLLEENVTLVYHAAAMIQFNDSLIDALIQNVRGTWSILQMAKRMAKLKAFVYVSTAYSNVNLPCDKAVEKVLPSKTDWKLLINILKTEDFHLLTVLKEKLLDDHPNPYTWSKSLAEQVVDAHKEYFPVIIMRPGIVMCTADDPFPGWCDGTNACFAFAAAKALGALHVYKMLPGEFQDFITVDTAIKSFLIAPWKNQIEGKEKGIEVYNCTLGSDMRLTYGEMEELTPVGLERIPSKNILWTDFSYTIRNPILYSIGFFIFQILPALILDLILVAFKKKTMFVSMNVKFVNGYRLAESVICNCIVFPNSRFKDLPNNLKDKDKEDFSYSLSNLNENKKELAYLQGEAFLKYFLKEDLSEENLVKNRKRYQRIKTMHNIIVFLGRFAIVWGIWCYIVS